MAVEVRRPYITQVEGEAGGKPIIVGPAPPCEVLWPTISWGMHPRRFRPGFPISPWPKSMTPCPSITTIERRLTPTWMRTGKSMFAGLRGCEGSSVS